VADFKYLPDRSCNQLSGSIEEVSGSESMDEKGMLIQLKFL
jgi:hypothetical protein